MNTQFKKINQYLWAAYLPPETFPTQLFDSLSLKGKGITYNFNEASIQFDNLFDSLLDEQRVKQRHIVPLSGGWDSRAILGALLERVPREQIIAVTFGAPGQLDYDLGKRVADSVNVQHYPIDLNSIEISWDLIRQSVKSSPWTRVPDGLYNTISRNYISKNNDVIWSGFLGDPLAGSHISESLKTKEQNISSFALKQRRLSSYVLCEPGFSYEHSLKFPKTFTGIFYEDVIDLGMRQSRCICSTVLPKNQIFNWGVEIGREKNGATVIAPFADKGWVEYLLFAPREQRIRQRLYLETLRRKFPELFIIPGKSNFTNYNNQVENIFQSYSIRIRNYLYNKRPQHCKKPQRMLNYIDFDAAFRERSDYYTTLMKASEYLIEERITPWIDIEFMITQHMKKEKNFGDAFTVLIGLAANYIENPIT